MFPTPTPHTSTPQDYLDLTSFLLDTFDLDGAVVFLIIMALLAIVVGLFFFGREYDDDGTE